MRKRENIKMKSKWKNKRRNIMCKILMNYGMDKMKFGQAVLSGQSIRLRATLQSLQNLRGTVKAEIKIKIEIKDQKKPALEGVAVFLYYFEN